MSDIIPYLEEMNRRCASGAPMRIEPKNARKSRKRSVGRCHRAHGKPLRGIDGVKYPVGTMHGMPKGGEGLRFNYVLFRDDNVRVDHKWTDGQQRYSVTRDWDYTPSDPQREYDEVVARYTNPDGTRKPGWMKAPNGRPTNLAERQWVQVRTPAFKAWFGDWEGDPANASKVVDENGEPLVVYHGPPNDFTAFRRDFLGSTTRGAGTEWGFYFSDSEDLARAVVEDYSGQEAKVIEGYLNIRNPLRVDLKDYDGYLDAALEQLQDSDYDGAVISGLVDHGIESENFLILDGKQVKSATDNTGEFGPSADIRHSVSRTAITAISEIANGAQSATIENGEIGEIGYPLGAFGEMTDGGRIRHGLGFLHIVYSRMAKDGASLDEAVATAIRVAESAANGDQTRNTGNRIWLDKDGIRAVVARNADGQKIITGYEIYAEEPWTTSRANHGRKRHPTPRLDDVLSALRRSIAYLTPEVQAPTPDAFVRDAVMGMLVAAGDGNGAADAAGASGGRPTPERASVRRGGSPVRIDDLAVGTLAQRILAGKDPTVDDARKFLDGFGLSRTLDAGAALRAARELAEANRERLKGEVERANPEVIGTLARANLSREMRSAMDSLVTGAARAVDPEVGMRLKDAVAARDRRALMAAKGFTAAEEARRRDDSERRMAERRDGEDADGGDYI